MPKVYPLSLLVTPGSSSLASSLQASSTTLSSIYTATTSRTIRSLRGKFIHAFGKTVLRGLESVFVRRRLAYIESLCPMSDNSPPPGVKSIYDDLVELARPGLYPGSVTDKAQGLICEQIKRSDTSHLMSALQRWPPHERTFILCEILIHFQATNKPYVLSEFETIISMYQEVFVHMSAKYLGRPNLLSGLSIALDMRFAETGQLADSEKAVLLGREALELQHSSNPHRIYYIHNLAIVFVYRFRRTSNLSDLEEGILLLREGLETQTSSHPLRSNLIEDLADDLFVRFEKMGQLADLEEAILLNRELLQLLPSSDPRRLNSLRNLATYLSQRSESTGQLADKEEANLLYREVREL